MKYTSLNEIIRNYEVKTGRRFVDLNIRCNSEGKYSAPQVALLLGTRARNINTICKKLNIKRIKCHSINKNFYLDESEIVRIANYYFVNNINGNLKRYDQ